MDAEGTDGAVPEDDGAVTDAPRPHPSRGAVAVVGTLIAVLVVANNVGNIFATTLAREHPAVLITLNSTNRMLLLTTNQLDAVSYYVIGSLRLLVADPLFFLLGKWYGDAAIRWVERKWASQGQVLRLFERGFQRFAYAFVFAAPNNVVCLLAGAGSMKLAGFLVANLAGTATRLFLIRWVGDALFDPLDTVLDFFEEYRIPLLVLSAAIVAFSVVSDRRKGTDELDVVEELEAIEDEDR
jgi:membrane protein DedA with SNARE-associated domain